MYIVTFYSFKGGVGRTLALANVGLELARTGRRVLLVDFDLEAPGLATFELLHPEKPHPGLVEYVSSFIRTNSAPDAMDFIYEVLGVGGKGGRLWVMPAGRGDKEYSMKLESINWQRLYAELNGYIMFEDLKAQWRKSLKPDYVLIDSRTGHTDIGGICTRQLPESVVILFFPNEQNLAGLVPIVSAIIAERDQTDGKRIELHFVMSNVPDLDDEQDILASLQKRFQTELGYDNLTQTIHRYDSMHLLNQSLFIVDRPKSRLAKEYMALTEAITEKNPEDREAVIRTLTNKHFYQRLTTKSQQDRIEEILKYHSDDKEVLYFLAMDQKRRGRREESVSFLKKSLELGYRSPEALLAQAEMTLQEREPSVVADDVYEAFRSQELDTEDVVKGIRILRKIAPEKLSGIVETPVFRALEPLRNAWLSCELMWNRGGAEAVVNWLSPALRDHIPHTHQAELILALIGLKRFEEATRLFGVERPKPESLSINDAFNYGMAEWGAKGSPSKDMFEHVIKLDSVKSLRFSANYWQCLAMSFWIIGKKEESLTMLDGAVKEIAKIPTPQFSCWRYFQVSPDEFQKDCESIKNLISGQNICPVFLQK